MKKTLKTNKGFISITLVIGILIGTAVLGFGGYKIVNQVQASNLIKQAEGLGTTENYEEAINLLEKAQARVFIKSSKEKISEDLEKYKQLSQDKSYYNQALEKFNNNDWQGAIDIFSKVSSISPLYQDSQDKINKSQQELENKQIYEQGLEKFNTKDWQGVLTLLIKIPQNSIYYQDAQDKIKKANEELKSANRKVAILTPNLQSKNINEEKENKSQNEVIEKNLENKSAQKENIISSEQTQTNETLEKQTIISEDQKLRDNLSPYVRSLKLAFFLPGGNSSSSSLKQDIHKERSLLTNISPSPELKVFHKNFLLFLGTIEDFLNFSDIINKTSPHTPDPNAQERIRNITSGYIQKRDDYYDAAINALPLSAECKKNITDTINSRGRRDGAKVLINYIENGVCILK